MATVLSHPAVPLAAAAAVGTGRVPSRLLALAVLASILPDLDAVGFWLGIPYAHPFGHRGFSHSIAFALLVALLSSSSARGLRSTPLTVFLLVSSSTLSHGLLDAMTDGGLGVAFFAPFSNRRFFFPWRPLEVSPIGVDGLLSARGARIFATEAAVIWLPAAGIGALGALRRRLVRGGNMSRER